MKNSASYLHIVIAIIFVLIFSACSKDDYEPALFSIRITDVVTYGQKNDMIFSFACNGSVIPDVKINDYYLEKFSNTSLIISANEMIPYSDTIQFSISAKGHTTSGILITPERIERVFCNNQAIYPTCDIRYAGNYHFTWDTVSCDHHLIGILNTVPERNILLESNIGEYTFSDNELPNNASLSLSAVNGDRLISGGEPGFDGDYGKGFCSIETTSRYQLSKNISNKSVERSDEYDHELFHQQHLQDFSKFLEFYK